MITEIKSVRPLCPRARNVEIVSIADQEQLHEVAVPSKIFNVGDLAIYFRVGSIVDKNYYLVDEESRNKPTLVRCKGFHIGRFHFLSEGMVAPLEWLRHYNIDKSLAIVGADLSAELKVVSQEIVPEIFLLNGDCLAYILGKIFPPHHRKASQALISSCKHFQALARDMPRPSAEALITVAIKNCYRRAYNHHLVTTLILQCIVNGKVSIGSDLRLVIKMDGKLFTNIPFRMVNKACRYQAKYDFEKMLSYENCTMTYEIVMWNTFGYAPVLAPVAIPVQHPVFIDKQARYRGRRCVSGHGLVKMANGQKKLVSRMAVGDVVLTLDAELKFTKTRIEAVTVDVVKEKYCEMVLVGNTWVTSGHPVCVDSFGKREWKRPYEIAKPVAYKINAVYNFILESRSSIFVNELEICTLGQFCPGIDVAGETYFGSESVVKDSLNVGR